MRFKAVLTSFFVLLFLFLFASPAQAGLLNLQKNGQIVWHVLASESPAQLTIPERSLLAIKEVSGSASADANSQISLSRENGKISLSILSDQGQEELDITQMKGEVIEVEERPLTKTFKVGILGDKFSLEQAGIVAVTAFPVKIDPQTAGLSVVTPSGVRLVGLLPQDISENILRAKILSKLTAGAPMILQEEGTGVLAYRIEGAKTINVFDLFRYDVPVKATVSAINGEILNLEQPSWLKIFGFMLI